MTVRIGFDMDGVLADFASAYRQVEVQLFGRAAPIRADDPAAVEEEPDAAASTPSEERRRRTAVWRHISGRRWRRSANTRSVGFTR
jgi:beta-phosphoglucomutase-like phosphatase (HAD superfamily)